MNSNPGCLVKVGRSEVVEKQMRFQSDGRSNSAPDSYSVFLQRYLRLLPLYFTWLTLFCFVFFFPSLFRGISIDLPVLSENATDSSF